jgi:FeS assembly protein IscX
MEEQTLSWEFPYEIALALKAAYPAQDLESLSLNRLHEMILGLPCFQDDPSLVNDDLLMSIYQDWYEEILHEQE